jgi:hypothetical protein
MRRTLTAPLGRGHARMLRLCGGHPLPESSLSLSIGAQEAPLAKAYGEGAIDGGTLLSRPQGDDSQQTPLWCLRADPTGA